jgi:hypothetical protein
VGISVHGNQNAGVINNVEGTQNVHGDQVGTVSLAEARSAVRSLDDALITTPMRKDARRAAQERVREIGAEVDRPQPDRARIADHLTQLGRVLTSTGTVVTAGSALLGPLRTLAAWVGPLAAPLLTLLPL